MALARKLGQSVRFTTEATQNVSFDVGTFWETLEHIADPTAALQEALGQVNRDGLLARSVPILKATDIRSIRGGGVGDIDCAEIVVAAESVP